MGRLQTEHTSRDCFKLPRAGTTVRYSRRRSMPGVEVRTVHVHELLAAPWFCSYCPDYEFLAPGTFQGEFWQRRAWRTLSPGWLMTARPGDLLQTRRVAQIGHFSSLILDTNVLQSYVQEHGGTLEQLRFEPCRMMSDHLRARFFRAIESLGPSTSVLECQANVTEFVATLLGELAGDGKLAPESKREGDAADHARLRLQQDVMGRVDLEALAQETGLSRFQLLRAFKRRFGLPPQTYRMRVRIGLAQKLLRDGAPPAGVAAELGFVDQSHMTRHFKRAVGLTPAKYVKSATRL